MSETNIKEWPEKIRQRYVNYLKTSFFFKEPHLRKSFRDALQQEGLLKGPFPESYLGFKKGINAHALATECFSKANIDLLPALIDGQLYIHQEHAIRASYINSQNVVVATGTASGKTESFLYPILFELYSQHLAGDLGKSGVRAMVLYPMNALANDQRERLGGICRNLSESGSDFKPTFGQYIGQTPYNAQDRARNGASREENRLPGELVFREEMRMSPPHILLTNYSMLEYLLIRPADSPLFDGGLGEFWQFIVLDEAHQYRGAKGMEMGMLVRRLKQRLIKGGRQRPFSCIATSATITSGKSNEDSEAVAEFASELFGESFSSSAIVFGESLSTSKSDDFPPRRYHSFLRALEGAFLVHREGEDIVVLNRKLENEESAGEPIEIALCRECGQHYYVGREHQGKLKEAYRDPSHPKFGVEFYLPSNNGSLWLCRRCTALSASEPNCDCHASIIVTKCDSHESNHDQLKECGVCGYRRGGVGDPVQEIVHGSDGPNTVIATAIHELLPEDRRKVLAFADSRQEAAFFAWYAEDSYEKLRDRNLIMKAINSEQVHEEGLSIEDLRNRLYSVWDNLGLFRGSDTQEQRIRAVITSILREAVTNEKRLALSGVGLIKWFVALPNDFDIPDMVGQSPWNFSDSDARHLIVHLLDEMRSRRAVSMPAGTGTPIWSDVSAWPQQAYSLAPPGKRRNVLQWGSPQSAVVRHFLRRLLEGENLTEESMQTLSMELMREIWQILRLTSPDSILLPAKANGTFHLDSSWLRIKPATIDEIFECNICATLVYYNVRGICPRNRCSGTLLPVCQENLEENHYRLLYESHSLPPQLRAQEHTAQIHAEEARKRQDEFKNGKIHLLSSSTTFEVGVDLGDLDTVFLRNVPPEPFNYTQRSGRAGRRGKPGLVLTYCRRNPHDLYHFEDPIDRVIKGTIQPPRLNMSNEKIVLRHMAAVALSEFFKIHSEKFKNVEIFVGDWQTPQAARELLNFCKNSNELKDALCHIVPDRMHSAVGLLNDEWAVKIAGRDSRLERAESEVSADYLEMDTLRRKYFELGKSSDHITRRMQTIAGEVTLNFLSRKAIIPKYGFPVDVVALDVHSSDGRSNNVDLQRDLSQAISEYAPGGKVVANKQEWKSCGVKKVPGKEWPRRLYQYGDARSFKQWNFGDEEAPKNARKYLIPEFGFVAPLFEKPSEPKGRTRRLYTTRPFFRGFESQPETKIVFGIKVTKAVYEVLVVLCEGSNREGFFICDSCGRHMSNPVAQHTSPSNSECRGTLRQYSLGHELTTDVLCLQFPMIHDEWEAYSVAYAILLGAADALEVPDTDLNVTITGGDLPTESAVVLYDNVPGGAGLVKQLERESVLAEVLRAAKERVQGNCGCDSSCYGCLRSYRNQFAHSHLNRIRALEVLNR